MSMSLTVSSPYFQFTLTATNSNSSPIFGPRLGTALLRRPSNHEIRLETPALLTPTSRGVVPHLSQDHCRSTKAITWVNVPFETFLQELPPVPTLQRGPNSLHKFLGYSPTQHILSMSARNPGDGHEMPPNGNNFISVQTLHGIRKLSPPEWAKYTHLCQPDIIFALSDTPHTSPPYSQKRLTKCVERSTSWLLSLLKFFSEHPRDNEIANTKPSVLVHMAGVTSHPARRAFANSLIESLDRDEAATVSTLGLKCLDDGVAGYCFDLLPLRFASSVSKPNAAHRTPGVLNSTTGISDSTSDTTEFKPDGLTPLIRTSLLSLPPTKPRVVNSTRGPHEMLELIAEIGVDLFDATWAVEAASIGVALDFKFPVPTADVDALTFEKPLRKRIGHNLYHSDYTFDLSPLADSFIGVAATSGDKPGSSVCPCAACSPAIPSTRLAHDSIPLNVNERSGYKPAFTRAYLHHLLHTHEMSAHALLVMHNLTVVDRLLKDVRQVLATEDGMERFMKEMYKFGSVYEDDSQNAGKGLMDEARECYMQVDRLRGKGRMKWELQEEEGDSSD